MILCLCSIRPDPMPLPPQPLRKHCLDPLCIFPGRDRVEPLVKVRAQSQPKVLHETVPFVSFFMLPEPDLWRMAALTHIQTSKSSLHLRVLLPKPPGLHHRGVQHDHIHIIRHTLTSDISQAYFTISQKMRQPSLPPSLVQANRRNTSSVKDYVFW